MLLIKNKRASFDYDIREKIVAGIELTGPEVKSLRLKMASLTGSYVQIIGGQPVLLNAQITPYRFARGDEYDPKRTRRLLLHRREVYRLQQEVASKHYTLIPLAFITQGTHIKVEVGLGKGRQKYEKRAHLRQKEWEREQNTLQIR